MAVRPGDGLLAVLAETLLFVPAADQPGLDEVLRVLHEPPPESYSGAEAIGNALVALSFVAPDLVVVDWSSQLTIMAFGAVQLTTDHPALPRMTGEGSEGWVERRLKLGGSGRVVVSVEPPQEDTSDLQRGIVPASGFAITIASGMAAPKSSASSGPAEAPDRRVDHAPQADPPPNATAAGLDGPEPTVSARSNPDSGEFLERAAGPASSGAAAAPAPPSPSPTILPLSEDPTDEEATLIPPRDLPVVSVEGRLCAEGHANPPHRVACEECGVLISPATRLTTTARPSLGTLASETGDSVPLDQPIVVGRASELKEASNGLHVDHEKVSRRHLRVDFDGWSVTVEDLGSTNGTFLGDSGVPIQSGTPVTVEPGTAIWLGCPPEATSLSFRRRGV